MQNPETVISDAILEIKRSTCEIVMHYVKGATYICSTCGTIVFPDVTINSDGDVSFTSESGTCTGGLGNKVLAKNVCPQCMKRVHLF